MPIQLFVDTNSFLDFYSIPKAQLSELQKLREQLGLTGIRLHLPDQVVNEFDRNREKRLKESAEIFKNTSHPYAIPPHMLDYPQVAEYRKAVEAAAQARSAMIDAEKLLTAAIDNQQVNWIASDSDVYAFFTALLSEHADIDDGLFDAAAELFGLKPDDQDEQANLDS